MACVSSAKGGRKKGRDYHARVEGYGGGESKGTEIWLLQKTS